MIKRYTRHPDIRLTELEGEGVALHLGNRRYFTVSESGLTLLNALSVRRTFDELVALLMEDYDVAREEAATTAAEFLRDCESAGLLLVEEGP